MNQVATKKEGALAVNLFEADAAQGAQNISQEDLALPFLKILGQLSILLQMHCTTKLMLCLVITKDSTLNGRTEVPAQVHL